MRNSGSSAGVCFWAVVLVSFALIGAAEARDPSRRTAALVAAANQAFAAGHYAEALEQYTKAQVEDPQNPVIQYDIGNALYKLGRFDEAQRAFDALKGADQPPVDLGRDGAYNQGDSFFQAQKYQEALEQYQRALELDSSDKDAKHNLELARLKLVKPPPPPPQPNSQEPQEKQNDKDKKDEPKPPPQASPTPSPGATPAPQPGEMSKEEASRLLDALDRAEHEERKADQKTAARDDEAVDW